MKTIFGRHHVRANFYHFVSILYVLTMALWGLDILSDMASTWIGFTLFLIDYIAQMYDPHPDNPGPWFKRHFHRFLDCDEDEVKDKEPFSEDTIAKVIVILLLISISTAITIEYTSILALH